ncbi:MAG: hypothetical protein ACI8XO_003220 [Verrucomicrobiales bacterium]|jgi:hypothetical protein
MFLGVPSSPEAQMMKNEIKVLGMQAWRRRFWKSRWQSFFDSLNVLA